MGSRTIYHFLEGKTILITGVTGFLAKVLVERILHLQPNINKLFLLLRAKDDISARQRFYDEVIETDLFKVLKKKWGANLRPLLADKVVLVPGDIALDNLGVKNIELRNEMWREIDIIVNSAATTNFYDRYDVVLAINAFGAVNVVNFAKRCLKVPLLIHISTAFLCCDQDEGIISEKPFQMGETFPGASASYLDIDAEKEFADETIRELRSKHATEKEIISTMKHLGRQRALLHGWRNAYAFTKAMGEMLLANLKENLDVVILRPTLITSTIKNPFPGWIEGGRDMNGVFIAYAKGYLSVLVGNAELKIDMIPCDMVVDLILGVMVAHAHQLPQPLIYHISSSGRNPLTYANLYNYMFHYFTRNPWTNSNGELVKVKRFELLSTLASFRKRLLDSLVPLERISNLAKKLTSRHSEDQLNELRRGVNYVIRLAEMYEPMLLFKGFFGDANTEKLLMMIKESNIDVDTLSFDSKSIKWDDYIMNIHFPGVKKYLMKYPSDILHEVQYP